MTWRSCIAQLFCTTAALFLASSSIAQDNREALGQAAEQAGRFTEALSHYTAALQASTPGSEAEQRLLERAVTITPKVRPLPALPAEAERRFVRGQAAVQAAGDRDAFVRAAEEFRAAVRTAPWLADAHYNLGIVLDKAERYPEAIRSLKLYMLAAPGAKDAAEAQRLIYQIEFRQEEAQRAKAKSAAEAATKADEQRRIGFLAGRWDGTMTTYWTRVDPKVRWQTPVQRTNVTMEIAISGTNVTMTRTDTGRGEFELVGRLTGSDAASIRWELPPRHIYAGEPVPVQTDPTRIYFTEPIRNANGVRVNSAVEIELRR